MNSPTKAWRSIAALALSAALAGCNLHGKPTVERKTRPIGAARPVAAEAAEADTVVSPGIVEPWGAQVDLSAQESGWIADILVHEGEAVRRGQLLATLDDVVQRRAVELAKADLAEADAALAKIERGATREELEQARADHDAAAARDAFAGAAAARIARLHDDGVVSDDERDRASAEARAQAASAARAAARLAEIERGPRIEDRNAAAARLLAARARLRVAEASLDRRRIIAASDATVLLSRLHAGEFYNAGAGPLVVLGDITRLQVRLEVDEIDAAAPAPGEPCTIYSDSGVRLANGTVVRLAPKMGRRALPLESPTARADIRVREVFVEVPATSRLLPNQRVWGHTHRGGRS
jgi:multidrug resistance efflux pump